MLITKIILLIFSLLLPRAFAIAQGRSNLWLMGYDSGNPGYGGTNINFISGSADTSYVFREMNFFRTNAAISSISGDLLFYTNGIYIANALNDTMQNGTDLNPGSFTSMWINTGLSIQQACIALPVPNDSLRYYLFHETLEYISSQGIYQPIELLHTYIDMSLDSGKGAVVFKNTPIISDTLLVGGVTACKHANGRDWWIITHRYNSDIYYTLLLTPYGIDGPFTQHAGQNIYQGGGGQSVFSPDGKKFVRYHVNDDVDIFDFDRCSGLLSNYVHIQINDSASVCGAAISPSSQYLYLSSNLYEYQFDLTDTNIGATQQLIGTYDNFYDSFPVLATTFYLSQLAPDGKIYINTGNGTHYLHVINYPDSFGSACNFTQHSFVLPTYNAATIPNYPIFSLGADTTSAICDSLTPVKPIITTHKKTTAFVFPNPSYKEITIQYYLPSNQTGYILIFNSAMQLINSVPLDFLSSQKSISVENLSAGLYLVNVVQSGQVISSGKFSVNH